MNEMAVDVTLVLPCYGRPELTRLAVGSVADQELAEGITLEVMFHGDGCPVYQSLVDDFPFMEGLRLMGGSKMLWSLKNYPERDGTPTRIINDAVKNMRGQWLMFMANDDRLDREHVMKRLSASRMPGAPTGMIWFDTWVEHEAQTIRRPAQFEFGCIGHSEIMVRREVAQSITRWEGGTSHHRGYGHDWDFIRDCKAAAESMGLTCGPAETGHGTYYVNMKPREHVYNEK